MWNPGRSARSAELPDDWEEIRSLVLREAGWFCEIQFDCCITEATEVDHIRRGNDHSRRNLRATCSACHARKTSAEGVARRRELRARSKRPKPRHPGSR